MSRKIGYKPLLALALAGAIALPAGEASAQHYRHGGYGGGGYHAYHHRGPNAGAVVGGALLGLGILGGAIALSQQAAPPPIYGPGAAYVPPVAYAPTPPAYYGYK